MGFIRGNRRRASMCVLSLLVCVVAAISNVSIATSSSTTAEGQELDQHLAVVVPSHRGDLSRTVASLSRWPTYCSPVTQKYVDLILYYAEGENDDAVDAALHTIAASAGQCFANTRVVFANLKEEDDIYPKGPSVQFYKMFLDEDIRLELAEYDALAIIEWDVLVASDQSFAKLYRAAFGSTENFWVKGSNVEGTNFHSEAAVVEMWHVLGHINGNAIYNNNDPAFVEYVDYTLSRWDYSLPYDVALWATLADFPYSWPLWQRYSSKFVTTNLISNVGFEHVDDQSVSDAVAVETLFIHGSSVDLGNVASIEATTTKYSESKGEQSQEPLCEPACGSASPDYLEATSTVCDVSCDLYSDRFGGYLCGAGDFAKFGAMCRTCYTDVVAAREAEGRLSDGQHVIMCDTMRPPQASVCEDKCALKKDTVCDERCGTGILADYNCNWRTYGSTCRFCFNDVNAARMADGVAKRHGGRVIMCDSHEPPAPIIQEAKLPVNAALKLRRRKRKLHDSGEAEDPKTSMNEGSQNNRCLADECVRTSVDGTKGRICDSSCEGGGLYGKLGCGAKKGKFGNYCRTCYNDMELAAINDSPFDRAIMCDTALPVEAPSRRQRSSEEGKIDSPEAHKLQKANEELRNNRCFADGCVRTSVDGTKGRICDSSCEGGEPYGKLGCGAKKGKFGSLCRNCYNDVALALSDDAPSDRAIMCDTAMPVTSFDGEFDFFMKEAAKMPFAKGVTRGNMCIFIAAGSDEVEQTDVTIQSILEFVPGMRIALATESDSVDEYRRYVADYPDIRVSATPSVSTSSLFADEFCGEGTSLIYYIQPGSIISRTFTSKDTHSPRGDLLVVYGDARGSAYDYELAGQTSAILGFAAPSFTFGTDLVLPASANHDLREELLWDVDTHQDNKHTATQAVIDSFQMVSVPQLMAALAYSKNTPGLWFVNPQKWVTQHLFKAASIWEVPLLKPRIACSVPTPRRRSLGDSEVAEELARNLEFVQNGGSCDTGYTGS